MMMMTMTIMMIVPEESISVLQVSTNKRQTVQIKLMQL